MGKNSALNSAGNEESPASSGGNESFFVRLADIPWGLILVAVALVFFLFGEVERGRAILTAAGLFGIGHGVHTAARVLKR